MRDDYEDIFYGYKDLVWSIILDAGVPHPDSDDVFQETWLSVCSSLRGYRGEASFQAWIGTIARRRCADYWEKRKRHNSRFNPAPEWDPQLEKIITYRPGKGQPVILSIPKFRQTGHHRREIINYRSAN